MRTIIVQEKFHKKSGVRKNRRCSVNYDLFQRKSEDFYNDCGILRLDLARDYESSEWIGDILSLLTKPFYDWFGCSVITGKLYIMITGLYKSRRRYGRYIKGYLKPYYEHN